MASDQEAPTLLPIREAVEELEDRTAAIAEGIRALAEPRNSGGDPHHGFADMLEESVRDLRSTVKGATDAQDAK